MHDKIKEEKELLSKLNRGLMEIKTFLIGDKMTSETCIQEKEPSKCLVDDMIENVDGLHYALDQLDIISSVIRGGNN